MENSIKKIVDEIISDCQIQGYWAPEPSNIFERLIVIKKNLLSSNSHLLVQPTTHLQQETILDIFGSTMRGKVKT